MSTTTWELTLCENQLHLINQKFNKNVNWKYVNNENVNFVKKLFVIVK